MSDLKEIRSRLQDAVDTKDWWVVKSQMNKIDTILFNTQKQKLLERSDKITLLEAYSLFLENNGYMDTGWRTESSFAIDKFL